jgi:hypothetical protein
LNERLGEIKALLDVERFTNKQTDDGSEVSLDDDFSEVTVGTALERQDKTKRKIKPTNVA